MTETSSAPGLITRDASASAASRLAGFRCPEDPRRDAAAEYAALTGCSENEAQAAVDGVLAHYHFGNGPYPVGMDRTHFGLIVHLTQPLRIPDMTTRLDWARQRIEPLLGQRPPGTALDYGGGGGKDAIVLARWGYRVTYCDLLSLITPFVARRFALRGLDVPVFDVRDLQDERYDLINCMDVIEHVYDVEYVTADVIARLKPGGVLMCFPAFFNSWDGDHVEKNCGYLPYFTEMLARVGVRLLELAPAVQLYVRDRPLQGPVEAERETLRRELYRHSLELSRKAAMSGMRKLVLRLLGIHVLRRRSSIDPHVDTIIDNLAIRRLSRQRLAQMPSK